MSVLRVRAYLHTAIALIDPLHLDGIAVAVARGQEMSRLTRGSDANRIARPWLPIASIEYAGYAIRICTAAEMAPDARRAREHLTRRRDGTDLDYLTRSVETRSGSGRDVMMPYAIWLTPWVEWWCIGQRQGIRSMIARRVTHVGMLRRHGMGSVARWEIEKMDAAPASMLVQSGRARRNLPRDWCSQPEAIEIVPVSPPYWHPASRTAGVAAGRFTDLSGPIRERIDRLC